MTSLAPSSTLQNNPNSIDLIDSIDSIDSLYSTWKSVDSLSTTRRRISNRTWRLMNLHVLHQCPSYKLHLMDVMLDDIKNGTALVTDVECDNVNQSPFRPRSQPDSPDHLDGSFLNRKAEDAGSSLTLKAMNDFTIEDMESLDPKARPLAQHGRVTTPSTKISEEESIDLENGTNGRIAPSRPSLFLTHSSQAILTVRKASNTYNSGEDTSDVSEDDLLESENDSDNECFGSDYLEHPTNNSVPKSPTTEKSGPKLKENCMKIGADAVLNSLTPAESGKNIFYILNSPSPTDISKPTKRQGLLFTNSKDELVSRAGLAGSVSSLEVSEDDEGEGEEYDEREGEQKNKVNAVDEDLDSADLVEEEMRRSMFSTISNNFAGSKLSRSVKSAKSFKSTDTDSEWVSVSSDGELPETSPIPPPLQFSKRYPLLTSPSSATKSGRTDSVLKDTPGGSFAPRSLLSGLFLNELGNTSGKNSIKSENGAIAKILGGLDTDKTATPSACASASASHMNLDQLNSKPILKRSSTTGIISVDRNATKKTMQRPSIILLKRYASLLDMSQKLASHRSPVLYVAEEDAGNEVETGIDSLVVGGNTVDENQFAKQVLSVGLSGFMVVANSTNASSVLQSHIQNGLGLDLDPSSLGLDSQNNQEEHNYQNRNHSQYHNQLQRGMESRLSTSLSKYSTQSITGNSFKSFLSKSSLNLTSIFGPTKPLKPRLEKRSGSADTVKSTSTVKSPTKPDEQPLSPSIAESPVRKLQGGRTKNAEEAEKATKADKAEKSEKKEKTEQGLGRSIKISSFPKKAFEPSVDISNSLKDSLLIDHKLGKIPMPDRVIQEEELFNGQDPGIFLPDSDDYHSKGW